MLILFWIIFILLIPCSLVPDIVYFSHSLPPSFSLLFSFSLVRTSIHTLFNFVPLLSFFHSPRLPSLIVSPLASFPLLLFFLPSFFSSLLYSGSPTPPSSLPYSISSILYTLPFLSLSHFLTLLFYHFFCLFLPPFLTSSLL